MHHHSQSSFPKRGPSRNLLRAGNPQWQGELNQQSQQDQVEALPTTSAGVNRRIIGKAGSEYFFLSPHEVLAFQAEGDLVWIHTAKKKYLSSGTLRSMEGVLQNSPFQRIHRNALINLNHVRKMSTLSSHRWLLTMDNGQEFVVSKRLVKQLREVLGQN